MDIYAIFDDHQKDQGDLLEIKKKLDSDCYVKLPGGFEGCFSNLVVMEAISKLRFNNNLVFTATEINTIKSELLSRGQQNIIDIIEQHYYNKTKRALPKVDLENCW
jgi:hypothetical protein